MLLIFTFLVRLGKLQIESSEKQIRATLGFELRQGNDSVGVPARDRYVLLVYFLTGSKCNLGICKITSLLGTCNESQFLLNTQDTGSSSI